MRLSEAIRLGAMLRPQITGRLLSDQGSCAMGAAAEAAGVPLLACGKGDQACVYVAAWPESWEVSREVAYPCGCFTPEPLEIVIVHLNDVHHWTREAIADWVETIEIASAPPVEPDHSQSRVVGHS